MEWFLTGYWPWWFSAIVFGVMTVGVWLIERRMLGVSGLYTTALQPPDDSPGSHELPEDPQAIEDALLRATLEEFGPEAVEAFQEAMAEESGPDSDGPRPPRSTMSRGVGLVFLVMLAAGGALGALVTGGGWHPSLDLGPVHSALVGDGAVGLAILVFGGILVGFGTRMAGGCTSGHGLSGCSRLQPGSLVATASFFGAAVVASFVLEALQ